MFNRRTQGIPILLLHVIIIGLVLGQGDVLLNMVREIQLHASDPTESYREVLRNEDQEEQVLP